MTKDGVPCTECGSRNTKIMVLQYNDSDESNQRPQTEREAIKKAVAKRLTNNTAMVYCGDCHFQLIVPYETVPVEWHEPKKGYMDSLMISVEDG